MSLSPLPSDALPNADDEELIKQKRKLETLTTAGCGYGRAKKKLLHVFWNIMWPSLEALGWTKVDGEGEWLGATYFVPKGVDMNTSRKRDHYYDRVRAVIDRVLEKRNTDEAEIAHTYLAEMGVPEGMDTDKPQPAHRRARRSPMRASSRISERRQGQQQRIDLSWKNSGKSFPRISTRVGRKYQATNLPVAGSYKEPKNREDSPDGKGILYDQVWDPKRAKECNIQDSVLLRVPPKNKEAAMVALHQRGYDANGLDIDLDNTSPMDGSDWTLEEKERFRREIFRLRKDMHALAKIMNKSVCNCLAYYMGTFKKSDDYRVLKTVCSEERAERQAASDQGLDACAICGDGGSLLICDGCEGEYHMTCLRPPLTSVPEGNWECDDCVNRKFLDARDYLIRNTGIYEKIRKDGDQGEQKISSAKSDSSYGLEGRSTGTLSRNTSSASFLDDEKMESLMLRPSSGALEAVQKLAECISLTLSASNGVRTRGKSGIEFEI